MKPDPSDIPTLLSYASIGKTIVPIQFNKQVNDLGRRLLSCKEVQAHSV